MSRKNGVRKPTVGSNLGHLCAGFASTIGWSWRYQSLTWNVASSSPGAQTKMGFKLFSHWDIQWVCFGLASLWGCKTISQPLYLNPTFLCFMLLDTKDLWLLLGCLLSPNILLSSEKTCTQNLFALLICDTYLWRYANTRHTSSISHNMETQAEINSKTEHYPQSPFCPPRRCIHHMETTCLESSRLTSQLPPKQGFCFSKILIFFESWA